MPLQKINKYVCNFNNRKNMIFYDAWKDKTFGTFIIAPRPEQNLKVMEQFGSENRTREYIELK